MITRLFGLNISAGEFLSISREFAGGGKPSKRSIYCFLNSHMLYEYHKTGVLRETLNAEEAVILPDGVPILKSLKWVHGIDSDRIAGNDVMFTLIDIAENQKLRLFLLGGKSDTLRIISDKLISRGIEYETYSPPFVPLKEYDFEDQAVRINKFNPDLVVVGLGCPKQELWMYHMRHKVNAPMFGLGGAFSLFAGVDTRAPLWMRNLSLEWLYRLSLEPGRLWKRYLVTNSYFIFLFLREFWRVRLRGKQ